MPTPMYMWIENDLGETIPGDVAIRGRTGSIEILQLEHAIHLPVDSDTSQVTGMRKHGQLQVTKAVDKTSPYFYEAVNRGKIFKKVSVVYYRPNAAGIEQAYYRVDMDNVKVAKMSAVVSHVKRPEYERLPHSEQVAMLYEQITWTYLDGNISHTDSWLDRGDRVS